MSNAQNALGDLPEWNLNDLYPGMDSAELKADKEKSLTEAIAFETDYKGKLDDLLQAGDAEALGKAVRVYEQMQDRLGRMISYAGLIYATDSSNPKHAKFYGDIQEHLTNASSHVLFFELELNRLNDVKLDDLMNHGALAYYKPWFADIRMEKPYQLDDKLEQLFHEKSQTGASAWNRLFDETMSSLTFELDGESLGIEQTLNHMTSTDAKKREAASNALAKTFGQNLRLFTLITNVLAKDKEISDRWRGFKDVADGRHLSNRVEREVVEALVSAVQDAYPRLSHRYYALKAKWFGKEKLNHWDRNAPLPKVAERKIGWQEAQDTVLEAFGGFSPDVAGIAKQFFDGGWIDAPVRPGKSPGAFAHPTVPSAHPYVMLNYQGKSRDVMTLAHELGHGVHQVLAAKQGALMAPTPLTLAETASVFGEMLTFQKLLKATKTVEERRALLASKVEDMINTVVRQIAFYSFERKVHEARRNGELTSDDLCAIWMSVQSESLGPAIELKQGYETFWTYIPHFIHSPFYVYAYSFGDCLVNSLYSVYQNADEGFVEKYMNLLKAGGSKHYNELLEPFGLDAQDPAFWQMGLKVVEDLITELESLEGK